MVYFLFQSAEDALRFYKGCKAHGKDLREDVAIKEELNRLQLMENERNNTAEKLKCSDFCMFMFTVSPNLIQSRLGNYG